jgi:hypothetical protein
MSCAIAPNGLAAKIGVGAGENHPHAALRERGRHVDDRVVEKLGFIDRDDFGVGPERAHQVTGGADGHRLDRAPVVTRHVTQSGVTLVEMRLEDLHAALRDLARRTRRCSSSLFPLNITPAITSIDPERGPCIIVRSPRPQGPKAPTFMTSHLTNHAVTFRCGIGALGRCGIVAWSRVFDGNEKGQ